MFTDEDRKLMKAVHDALLVQNPVAAPGANIAHQVTQIETVASTLWDAYPDGIIKDAKGSLARTIKRIAQALKVSTD